MSTRNPRQRGARYRFTTSMLAGVLVVLALAWYGHHRHDPHPLTVAGAAFAAVAFSLVMFTAWSAIALFRRVGARAAERVREAERAERERERAGRRRGRRYAGSTR